MTTVWGCVAVAAVALLVGLAFGLAGGLMLAEPRYRDPLLHGGEWELEGVHGSLVIWKRKTDRRKECHDEHRAYVCTIDRTTAHVDACDCGKTRQGVYGTWS